MTREPELSTDARALLRAALPMDEPNAQQRAALVRRFEGARKKPSWSGRRERRTMVWAFAFGCASVSTVALAGWGERWLPFLANLPGYRVEPVVLALPSPLPQVQKRADAWAQKPLPLLEAGETLLPLPGTTALDIEGEDATTPLAQVSVRHGSSSGSKLEDGANYETTRQREEEQPVSGHTAAATGTTSAISVVASELRLITQARDELQQHNYANVRRLTERHAREFRGGVFTEERRAMSALSRCLGQGDASAAMAFARNSPHSVFTPRIIRDCELPLNPVPEPPGDGTH